MERAKRTGQAGVNHGPFKRRIRMTLNGPWFLPITPGIIRRGDAPQGEAAASEWQRWLHAPRMGSPVPRLNLRGAHDDLSRIAR